MFSGVLQEIQKPLNPHEFDYYAYLQLRNIGHSFYLKEESWLIHPNNGTSSLFNLSQKIRKQLLDAYRASGLEQTEFAMVAALVLGYEDNVACACGLRCGNPLVCVEP